MDIFFLCGIFDVLDIGYFKCNTNNFTYFYPQNNLKPGIKLFFHLKIPHQSRTSGPNIRTAAIVYFGCLLENFVWLL